MLSAPSFEASVCPVVHLGCVPRPVNEVQDEPEGAYPATPLNARAQNGFVPVFLS